MRGQDSYVVMATCPYSSADSVRDLMEKSRKHKQGISRHSGSPMTKGKNSRFMSCIFTMLELRKYHAEVPLGALCHLYIYIYIHIF